VFGLFKKKDKAPNVFDLIQVDIHSHLLPGLDDGVQTFSESVEIIREFIGLGYRKIITTPHINSSHYPNEPADILHKLDQLKKVLSHEKLNIEINAAAEYYMDENFLEKLENNEKLLTFGDNYILVETSFFNEPVFLKEIIFKLNANGYKPILAHPERYSYLQTNEYLLRELAQMNIYLQMNLNSLVGLYSKGVQNLAEYLIDHKLIQFVGTDCHNPSHVEELKKLHRSKYFKKLAKFNLRNSLL